MIFSNATTWQYGGKVEVSTDDTTWTTLLDQSTSLGNTATTPVEIPAPGGLINVRYVRITDYYSSGNGTGTGVLLDFEAFSASTNTLARPGEDLHRVLQRRGHHRLRSKPPAPTTPAATWSMTCCRPAPCQRRPDCERLLGRALPTRRG